MLYKYNKLVDEFNSLVEINEYMREKGYLPETFEMCKEILDEEVFGLDGIYVTDKYYCTWTKGKHPNEIASAKEHEICHDLVFKDYEHFCEIK
jgi:hypothetical protein